MPGEIIQLMTCRIRLILTVAVLILLSIVAINMMLVNAPVVIQIEGDTFKVIEIPYSYTTKDAYILLVIGLVGGMAISHILFCLKDPLFKPAQPMNTVKIVPDPCPNPQNPEQINVILRALAGDEKKTIKTLKNANKNINYLLNILRIDKF